MTVRDQWRFLRGQRSGWLGRSPLVALAAVVVAGCALAGCGRSDEDEIRDVSRAFLAALRHNDGRRACELMTMRASAQLRAQLATSQDAAGSCENVIKNTRPDRSPAPAAVARARLTARRDLAVLRFGADVDSLGLRRAGSWRVDNLLNPRLNETTRPRDQALVEGSDATQINATMDALSSAVGKRDYRRICDLISPGFEAPLLVNAIFIRIFTHPDEEPSDVSCAGAFKEIERVARLRDQERIFDRLLSALHPVDGSDTLSIRADKATIGAATSRGSLIKIEGQWLLDNDPAPLAVPAELTRCWRRAGARIAIDASDLRFAAADNPRDSARAHGSVSVKGDDWRIFYALVADGADPGLARVVSNPTVVPVVAYVRHATAHPTIVDNARRCGD